MVYIGCYECSTIHGCKKIKGVDIDHCLKCKKECEFSGMDGMDIGIREEVEYNGICEACADKHYENEMNGR